MKEKGGFNGNKREGGNSRTKPVNQSSLLALLRVTTLICFVVIGHRQLLFSKITRTMFPNLGNALQNKIIFADALERQ